MKTTMARVVTGFLMVTAFLAAAPASAQFAGNSHLIPVIARLQGAEGTFWKSDLSITNASPFPVTLGAAFFREKTPNDFPVFSFPVTVTIAAEKTLTVEDVLGTWFPAEGDTKGMLFLVADSEEADLAVSSRTYNAADPRGTYGQAVQPSLFPAVYGAGKAIAPGVRNDADYRTSLGILNLGPSTAIARIRVYDADGNEVVDTTRTIQRFSMDQWNVTQLGVPTLDRPGQVEVSVDPSSGGYSVCDTGQFMESTALLAYTSTVDNRTGDAVFSLAQASWADYYEQCGETPDEDCDPMN